MSNDYNIKGVVMNMQDATIFCPQCVKDDPRVKSEDWIIVNVRKDFSAGKAALGAIALGPIGLLGGAVGSPIATYRCLKCGYTGDYKMRK